jgi:DNA-binding XRE family transcriptional regulator
MGRVSNLNERALIALVREGRWLIDDDGRVWIVKSRRRAEHRLPQGYLQVRATIDGRRLHTGAHRLVWQHFRGDIPLGAEINHDNGLKDDNRPNNLLCGTSGDNTSHAHRGGLIDQHGQRNPSAKLTDNEVARIRLAYSRGGYTQAQLAERFGVRHQTVSKIVRGQRRPKQGGPTCDADQRRAGEQDQTTGRFIAKARSVEHNGFPT